MSTNYKIYSGIYYVPYYEYCNFCEYHHLRWRIERWEYEDKTIINKKKLTVSHKIMSTRDAKMSEEGKEFMVRVKKEILRFECCDCSLTHDFEFDIKNKERIGIIIKRNNYSTNQSRRKK